MKKLRVMIVSHPGTWQRVLEKNLLAYPFVDVVDVVTGSLSASQLAKKTHPRLILIDSSIPIDDAITLVQIMKRENTNTSSVVITDTTQQRRKVIRAGADYTISSFNYESQIGEILHHLTEPLPDEPNKSETNIETKSSPI